MLLHAARSANVHRVARSELASAPGRTVVLRRPVASLRVGVFRRWWTIGGYVPSPVYHAVALFGWARAARLRGLAGDFATPAVIVICRQVHADIAAASLCWFARYPAAQTAASCAFHLDDALAAPDNIRYWCPVVVRVARRWIRWQLLGG